MLLKKVEFDKIQSGHGYFCRMDVVNKNTVSLFLRKNSEHRIFQVDLKNSKVDDCFVKDNYHIDTKGNVLFAVYCNKEIFIKKYDEIFEFYYMKLLKACDILIMGVRYNRTSQLDVYDTSVITNTKFLFSIKGSSEYNFTVSKDRKKIAVRNYDDETCKIFSLVYGENGDELFRGSDINELYFHETNSDIVLYTFQGEIFHLHNIATGEKRELNISSSIQICFDSEKLFSFYKDENASVVEVYDIRNYKKYFNVIFGYAMKSEHANVSLLCKDVFGMIKEYL